MSKTIKFTVSDENYEKLMQKAGDASIQDYIRSVLFPDQTPLVTPEDAVKKAKANAKSGDTVILSPGFASFDEFKDYRERGNKFSEIINRE